ncbi:DUF6803 family protein [Luedemannella flava]|uniref:DUF6803 family protein n=1 Tax=Luedemannella flava TaxID=349316 RepID=UPI0031D0B1AD
MAAVATAVAVGAAWALPDLPGEGSVAMTHYMQLLATNQPWNLLIFMAVPVILAETVAVSELAILFNRASTPSWVRSLNRWAGLLGGVYFVGVFGYLLVHAVIPLTTDGGWRGPADIIAVGAYLSGVIPLFGIALLEFGVLGRGRDETARLKLHAALVGLFLIVAHLAMIFGMLDPTLLGWHTAGHAGMQM